MIKVNYIFEMSTKLVKLLKIEYRYRSIIATRKLVSSPQFRLVYILVEEMSVDEMICCQNGQNISSFVRMLFED